MILSLLVEPVPVGRLHDCVICFFRVDRIPDQWLVEVSDIAGKDDLLLHSVFLHPDFNGSRAQQMADIRKPNRNLIIYFHNLIVVISFKMLQYPQCVVHLV